MFRIRSGLAAILRLIVLVLLLPFARVWSYANGPQAGYTGGINLGSRPLAFIRDNGRLQTRW